MLKRLEIKTTAGDQLVDITSQIKKLIKAERFTHGSVVVYCPHTTCGITINENADPAVRDDILLALDQLVPHRPDFKHAEGNSHAHIKASLLGSSVTVFVESATLVLGTWQGIYLCEFDGPRQRSVLVKLVAD
ncbi:MAG: hypothetical protein BWY87_00441 [Deltaproteobacteria bacterium ADurb.Bin510]|nr:MAG: hypothetical protein BWY87_00441 [Deltaproteobacteria bacterium ADurb.Bin510]